MISYRHFPTDWQTFIPPNVSVENQSRRVMMCGRKARYYLCGIPGVSEQAAVVNGRPGWCIECLGNVWQDATLTNVPIPELQVVYDILRREILRSLTKINDAGLV